LYHTTPKSCPERHIIYIMDNTFTS
jgi:hypothetical protein